jgi:hypothetical protein
LFDRPKTTGGCSASGRRIRIRIRRRRRRTTSIYSITLIWVDSASNRNEYQEHFLGVKAAGV